MQLHDSTAIVTGGTSGLGEATVRWLSSRGSRVLFIGQNERAGIALERELGPRVRFCRADVTVTEQLQEAVNCAVAEFGAVHMLVNSAGTGKSERTLSKNGPHDIGHFRRHIEVNLIGAFDAIRLRVEAMSRNEPNEWGERGVIVNTSSIAAFEGQAGQAAYAASKGGLVALTLTLARDLASLGIRVCTIAPGLFETPMLGILSDELKASLGRQIPFPSRLGRPEEFAMLVQQVMENPMLNGETIRLDGALRLPPR